ncbi:DUF559 domain-containing protein [Candidatus Uhrbacteria bacterium]|nr:MAG: DUF559 domain-containing protein [Candidatus Uhrbacteria bacterium]
MNYLYNDPLLTERRRELRRCSTDAERALWERLRGRRFQGLRFRRQFGVDRFILDFYCPRLRLGIEVDGDIHLHSQERDRERDEIIEAHNIQVLRFWNREIFENIDTVLRQIAVAVEFRKRLPL